MKQAIVFIGAFLISMSSIAQGLDFSQLSQRKVRGTTKTEFTESRIYYGGYATMNFSRNYSVLGFQPLVGYKFTPKTSVGGQLSYEYISDERYGPKENGSNYGFSIFSRYRFSPLFYAHTEFSLMSYKWFYSTYEDRKWAPMLYVGGGYSQPLAPNVWLNGQVLFDVLNHKNSPYNDWEPYFSVGIGVGF